MNLHLHRLVFSRRHGALVAVAEHTRAGGKCARGEGPGGPRRGGGTRPATVLASLALLVSLTPLAPQALAQARAPMVFASRVAPPAAPLPVPYGRGGSGGTPRPFAYDPA